MPMRRPRETAASGTPCRAPGRSASDSEFRQRLLADPKTAIGAELDIDIPESVTVVVHQSDMETLHLALPPDANLTEEQLEAVSAGLCCCW